MYKLVISAEAKKKIKLISKIHHQEALNKVFEDIKEDPLLGKPLERKLIGRYSYKMSFYRIIYTINFKDKIIAIIDAGHRAKIYK